MSRVIEPVRGMNDILPDDTACWQHLEAIARRCMAAYDYREIRLPIVEQTALFERSVGEVTDIVEKEMYTFTDRSGESLTLRPEGTAVCVRAGISNGLLYNQRQRFWYAGPMFRYERPQKGRYRQFYQIGAEAFGFNGPHIDAELLLLSRTNFPGPGHRQSDAADQFAGHGRGAGALSATRWLRISPGTEKQLDEDSLRRLQRNPLRILDSKNPAMAELNAAAPSIADYLDGDSIDTF